MSIISLGKIIDPLQFEKYIKETESLETIVHKYGSAFDIPDYPCWMEYRNEGDIIGSISFTRHTNKNSVLAEMVMTIAENLKRIFPKDHPPVPERIHLIKTRGNIVAHRDEAGRYSCINIGLRNSSLAITRMSNDGILDNFQNNNTAYRIDEGVAYLVNTNQYHSVEGDIDIDRYLITYGFNTRFETLKNFFRYSNESR